MRAADFVALMGLIGACAVCEASTCSKWSKAQQQHCLGVGGCCRFGNCILACGRAPTPAPLPLGVALPTAPTSDIGSADDDNENYDDEHLVNVQNQVNPENPEKYDK